MFTENHKAFANIDSREELIYHLQERRYHLDYFYICLKQAMDHLKKSEYHASSAKEARQNLSSEDV